MPFSEKISLRRLFIILTIVMSLSFFSLLVVANVVNRKGITEIQSLDSEISEYEQRIRILDHDIATASSLIRIERRARELGLTPTQKIEYLK